MDCPLRCTTASAPRGPTDGPQRCTSDIIAATAPRGQTVLSWVVGVPFWAGVIVGVLVTLLVVAIL